MNMSQNVFPENPIYGQSYVPIQYLTKTYKPDEGLKMGSIFPELVMPYSPGQSIEENTDCFNQILYFNQLNRSYRSGHFALNKNGDMVVELFFRPI